jgi:hypothetical protein
MLEQHCEQLWRLCLDRFDQHTKFRSYQLIILSTRSLGHARTGSDGLLNLMIVEFVIISFLQQL